jgi:hypothetical protein
LKENLDAFKYKKFKYLIFRKGMVNFPSRAALKNLPPSVDDHFDVMRQPGKRVKSAPDGKFPRMRMIDIRLDNMVSEPGAEFFDFPL